MWILLHWFYCLMFNDKRLTDFASLFLPNDLKKWSILSVDIIVVFYNSIYPVFW